MDTNSHNPLSKLKFLILNGFIFALSLVMIQACGSDDDGPTDPPSENGNIAEVASSNDNFSDLVSALEEAGLVSTLEGDGPFTVFAPTNEAFANLSVNIDDLTEDQLVEVLSYHVVSGNIASGDLSAEQSVETLAGGNLFVTAADGEVRVNDNATVVNADIEASNGVIHGIDQVVLPDSYQDIVGIISKRYGLQSLEDAVVSEELASALQGDGPFTVFAPTNEAFANFDLGDQNLSDVLQYHVIEDEVLSGDLSAAQTVTTMQGEELTIEAADGTVTLTDNSGQMYEVTEADLQGTNGIVHIIDGVLNPAPNIVDVASSNSDFSTLVDALGQTGLAEDLQGAGPFTVFAPTNDAFSGVDLPQDPAELADILQYHVVSGNIASGDLTTPQTVEALAGGDLFVTAENGDIIVNNNATVTTPDVGASNGTIHVVNQVLLPNQYLDIVQIAQKDYNLTSLVTALSNANLVSTLKGDGPFTVFAPTNAAFEEASSTIESLTESQVAEVLQYHAAAANLLAGDLSDGQTITTVQGEDITVNIDGDGNVTLNGSVSVVEANREGTNGVVHIIDGVLVPPSFN